jgi:hypothetical protein
VCVSVTSNTVLIYHCLVLPLVIPVYIASPRPWICFKSPPCRITRPLRSSGSGTRGRRQRRANLKGATKRIALWTWCNPSGHDVIHLLNLFYFWKIPWNQNFNESLQFWWDFDGFCLSTNWSRISSMHSSTDDFDFSWNRDLPQNHPC